MKKPDLLSPPFVLLDDCRASHLAGPSWLYHSPEKIITAHRFSEIDSALVAIDAAVADGYFVTGWVAYEAAHAFENKLAAILRDKAHEPLVWMMVTKHRVCLQPDAIEALFHQSENGNQRQADLTFTTPKETEASYRRALERVQDFIAAGDVYQINYTFPQPFRLVGATVELYRRLRQNQPVSYGAYINTGEHQILSLSPELFIEKRGDTLLSKPMKGTAPRGRTLEEDTAIKAHLQADEKSRAENLMIVDLIRNDISRISLPGSVKATPLFSVETYPTLHQMTSSVHATAKADLSPSALLKAMFPCGSVTGAPKIRAMEVIRSLETAPRGVYCGTIGHFCPPDTATGKDHWTLSVPIRTMVITGQEGRISVGSGIVADSVTDAEYAECLLKARFAATKTKDFCLIETLRFEAGDLLNLDRHLARMEQSAQFFAYPFSRNALLETLTDHTGCLAEEAPHRIRLLLDKKGNANISSHMMLSPAAQKGEGNSIARVCLSPVKTDSGDMFLFHKTTNRALYDQAFAIAARHGYVDMLFFNERGELTEGAISSVFIVRDGIWYTPPIESGLLAGVMREKLLSERPEIKIAPLTKGAVLAADSLYIANSLRGLRQVELDVNFVPDLARSSI